MQLKKYFIDQGCTFKLSPPRMRPSQAQKSKETNESFHGVDRKKSRRDAAGGKKKEISLN